MYEHVCVWLPSLPCVCVCMCAHVCAWVCLHYACARVCMCVCVAASWLLFNPPLSPSPPPSFLSPPLSPSRLPSLPHAPHIHTHILSLQMHRCRAHQSCARNVQRRAINEKARVAYFMLVIYTHLCLSYVRIISLRCIICKYIHIYVLFIYMYNTRTISLRCMIYIDIHIHRCTYTYDRDIHIYTYTYHIFKYSYNIRIIRIWILCNASISFNRARDIHILKMHIWRENLSAHRTVILLQCALRGGVGWHFYFFQGGYGT